MFFLQIPEASFAFQFLFLLRFQSLPYPLILPNLPKEKPHSSTFKKWGSRSPFHTFPPSNGTGEVKFPKKL
jgi:hypothetical protein